MKKKTKLSPADEKFIAKFLNLDGKLDFSVDTITRQNPISGVTAEVDPICAACFDFAYSVYQAMYVGDKELKKIHPDLKMSNAVSNYDRARYIFMKLDGDGYSKLLD
jgi:hypothetical protein